MVGDSLGLVLVIPVNKDARRAGEIDQIAFEIDLFHSGLRGLFLFGHATSDQVFQVSVSEEWEGGNEIGSNANKKAATNKLRSEVFDSVLDEPKAKKLREALSRENSKALPPSLSNDIQKVRKHFSEIETDEGKEKEDKDLLTEEVIKESPWPPEKHRRRSRLSKIGTQAPSCNAFVPDPCNSLSKDEGARALFHIQFSEEDSQKLILRIRLTGVHAFLRKKVKCSSFVSSGRLLTHWIGKRDGKKTARAYGTQRKSDFGQGLPLPAPSGQVNSAPWIEDPREIDILLGSSSVPGTSVETGTSVTQPRAGPVNPEAADSSQTSGDPVASPGEEADSNPSSEDIQMARIHTEDLFEVKVEIIKLMAVLDPTGDWMGRGARALDNPRTATGEESVGKLYALLEDLQTNGVQSPSYKKLKGKVFQRIDPDMSA
ncbi:unnamed protein product [Dovyalis caffra]|uniref:DUF8018 domain-containing protein n=2 Tax=Dovyalis caffra TaxID=77055 RepID=A0AAV1R6R5_9ROSI|nr:unnamed protein product [Dovyalis caffra]